MKADLERIAREILSVEALEARTAIPWISANKLSGY